VKLGDRKHKVRQLILQIRVIVVVLDVFQHAVDLACILGTGQPATEFDDLVMHANGMGKIEIENGHD
jgi:hypothetical protein